MKKGSGLSIILFLLTFCSIIVILSLFFGFSNLALAARIEGAMKPDIPKTTKKSGTDILIGGKLDGEPGDSPFKDEAQKRSLVIYALEKWTRSCDDDGCWSSWSRYCIVFPEMTILDGTGMTLYQRENVALDKIQVATGVIRIGSGIRENRYREGSIRIVGYKSGRDVTLLGKRGPDGILIVDHVFGDKHNKYYSYVHNKASFCITTAIIFTVFTLFFIALGFIFK